MALNAFNPLTIFNDLRNSGMPKPQAQSVVRGLEQTRSDLATKTDIDLLWADIERAISRAVVLLASLLLAATGIIVGAIAAF